MFYEKIKKAIREKRAEGFIVPDIFEEIVNEVEEKEMDEMARDWEKELGYIKGGTYPGDRFDRELA